MSFIYQALDGTDLSNAQVGEIVGLSESRLGGIYGRDNNFHVTIERDSDASSPAEWGTEPAVMWAQLRNNYVTGRAAGANVPAALENAVDQLLPENDYGYRADSYEFRVIAKYAALHGYRAELHRFDGTSPSDWTDFVFLAPTAADNDMAGLAEVWRTYWDGDVYTVSVHADDFDETMSAIYGDDHATEVAYDAIRGAVAQQQEQNHAARELMFA